jgi:hypothetical protein
MAMTVNEALLQKLGKWKPSGRQTLAADAAGWSVAVTADRGDELGCLVWDLTVSRSPAPAEGVAVREWADRVAGRARGLMENLKLVEVDAERRQALLRSDEPTRRGDDIFYYEVLLTGGGSGSVRRFQGGRPNGRREQVPFALTHEVLAKLSGDLTCDK